MYDDGSITCFSCRAYFPPDSDEPLTETRKPVEAKSTELITDGWYEALPHRGLTEATCERWDYQVGTYHDAPVQIANYKDSRGRRIAQKLRKPGKKFQTLGMGKNMPLYGQWLWRDGGKSITIVEGEIDALSFSQALGKNYAVVSLPNGAQSAVQSITEHLEWLSKFDSIVLMFDQDKPGQEAIDAVLPLLPVGKVKIATLPEKDANETLVKHGPKAVADAFWGATEYRPDGIISGEDLDLDELMTATQAGYTLRYPKLHDKLLGLRKGELTLITAGSGIGKSHLAREIAYDLAYHHGAKIGNVFLEENNVKTGQSYIALHNNVPLGRLRYNPSIITPEQWREGKEKIVNQMWFYDHFGSLDSTRLLHKLRYLAALGVDFIILDHISIVTSGQESSSEGERKDIDILMTRLRSLIEETGIGVLAIVHLKRVQGKNFNEGAQVSLTDLRGSAALEQLSDNVISAERNQQDENATEMLLRVLKARETGETGPADRVNYDRTTGRLKVVEAQAQTPVEF